MVFRAQGNLKGVSRDAMRNLENEVLQLEEFVSRVNKALPKSTVNARNKAATQRIQGKLTGAKISLDSSGAPIQNNNEFRKLRQEVGRLGQAQKKMQFQMTDLLDPSGSIFSKLLGGAGAFLPVGIIASIAAKVYSIIDENYGRGGVADPSKRERNAVKSLIGLERENIILSGESLFLGDTTLRQGIPQGRSNTETLTFGTRLYALRHAGYQGNN